MVMKGSRLLHTEVQPKTIKILQRKKKKRSLGGDFRNLQKQHGYTYVELKSAQLLGVVEGSDEVMANGVGVSRTASLGAGVEDRSVTGLPGAGTSFSGIFSA